MAIVRVHAGETGPVVPGDAVFSVHPDPKSEFPIHVGICAIARAVVDPTTTLPVIGLPDRPGQSGEHLGAAEWGTPKQYRVHVLGQRRDVDLTRIKEVLLICDAVELEHSRIPSKCEWNERKEVSSTIRVRDGLPLFIRGTCAHFVEYAYEAAGLDLVDQDATFDPSSPTRLFPATQLHAFWSGTYPLRAEWTDKLRRYPDCMFGARSET